ncbi:hypothetical protein GRI97_08170 [Altererythrobacter xixiisoli]|uniref:Uncharacterized protein n=1 Tax=Croceibacterium xixiisoli TaxID=1476466 RepID=A0A6I4TSV0_9SPHN|nr:hypothetical protein [Croceibacterium xixiisoli]MXO98962.1 hypothetical protein [Croceibacterium xixiisoli]
MTNPLTERVSAGATFGHRSMAPGETRVVVDTRTGRTITIHRTARDYVHDLCDAYNAALSPAASERGLAWVVTPSGALMMIVRDSWSLENTRRMRQRRETESSRMVRRTLEAERML